MRYLRLCIVGVLLTFCIQWSNAQRIALKTNVLDWATVSPNLALEMRLNQKFSLDVSMTANPFMTDIWGQRWTHYRIQPEFRYWTTRPMARHFFGVGGLGCIYRARFNDTYYEGDLWGIGASYGYVFVLSRHWNIETTAGVGGAYMRAEKYTDSSIRTYENNCNKWLPTIRLGVSVSYVFE